MQPRIQVLPAAESEIVDFDWGQLTWFANHALGNSDEMTVGRCILKPGRSNPRHHHPNCSEILLVIKGRIRHTLSSEKEVEMKEGDTVTIPAQIWHNATNVGDKDAVLLIVFSSAKRETVGE